MSNSTSPQSLTSPRVQNRPRSVWEQCAAGSAVEVKGGGGQGSEFMRGLKRRRRDERDRERKIKERNGSHVEH